MIWFGNLERIFVGPVPPGLPGASEDKRMQFALERVAEIAPGLSGAPLLDAIEATGWIDRGTAQRLLPAFRDFDPDRHFADYMRRLSFRGRAAADAFRDGVRYVFEEVTGSGALDSTGPEPCIRFSTGEKEGYVLAQPEVGFTVAGRTRQAVEKAVDEMPDAIVIVARTFDRAAAEQLGSILHRTGVPGTLVTINLLMGIRAATLRYGTEPDRVVEVLARGGALRSPHIAVLSERPVRPQRFHMPGWNSSSTV